MAILPEKPGIPKVLLLGRANVGKSTLFNRLARRRIAITDDVPHTTRDFLAVEIAHGGASFLLVDAAGFLSDPEDTMQQNIRKGLEQAIIEADLILFLLDAEAGPTAMDYDLLNLLRRLGKHYIAVVNKIHGPEKDGEAADFYALGFEGELLTISARGGYGCRELLSVITREVSETRTAGIVGETDVERAAVAVIGRPNSGKSTLINNLIGDERVLVDEKAGTTRDAVDISFTFDNTDFQLVDTAGIRRMSKEKDKVEEYSLAKAFSAVKRSDVVLLVIDGEIGPTAQDGRIAGYAHDRGKGIILFVNKSDLLSDLGKTSLDRIEDIRYKYKYLQYAPVFVGSALNDDDLSGLLNACRDIARNRRRRLSTSQLNRLISDVMANRRFTSDGKEVKILYAAQVDIEPPRFKVSVNLTEKPHFSFARFLENQIREFEDFSGTPIFIEFELRRKKGERR